MRDASAHMSRNSGLSLDKEGRWRHEGDLITHERTLAALNRGLHVRPDGQVTVRVGPQWAFVRVDVAPYFVRNLRFVGDNGGRGEPPQHVELLLSDETREVLDPESLTLVGDGELYCGVKGHSTVARFLRAAYHNLVPLLVETDVADRPVGIELRDGVHAIRTSDVPPSHG